MKKSPGELKALKAMKDLTHSVSIALRQLDLVMKMPSSELRGRLVAKISNDLEMRNDAALHFTLGLSFKVIEKRKAKLKEEVAEANKEPETIRMRRG